MIATALSFNNPVSPSVSVSGSPLPADKKEEDVSGRERASFDQTRGNWGNRVVLTTYPGQANVGSSSNITYLNEQIPSHLNGEIRIRVYGALVIIPMHGGFD